MISAGSKTPLKNRSKLFYKQLYVEGNDGKRDIDFDQTLIVTYSLKYRNYQQQIRNQQILRAIKAIDTEPKGLISIARMITADS